MSETDIRHRFAGQSYFVLTTGVVSQEIRHVLQVGIHRLLGATPVAVMERIEDLDVLDVRTMASFVGVATAFH
jgi:hypothetical protein